MTRIVYFSPFLPYPATSGNLRRVLSLLDGLGRIGCHTRLLTLAFPADAGKVADAARELTRYGVREVVPYFLRSPDFRLGRLLARARGWWAGEPDRTADRLAHSPLLARWVRRQVAAADPDVVWMTYAAWDRLLDHRAAADRIRVVESQDLISVLRPYLVEVERRLAETPWRELPAGADVLDEGYFDGVKVEPAVAEFAAYDRYTHTLAISRSEADLIAAHTSKTTVVYQPMTCPVPAVENTYAGSVVCVMAGAGVNTLGLAYLVKRVLPRATAAAPGLRVRVVGSGAAEAAGLDGVDAVGVVPDLAPEYAVARFAIVPVAGWTGQSVRIVEAMAHGLPVVALERLGRSSPLVHGENGLVARDAGEFADHMARLWADPTLCRRLGEAARATVAAGYSQDALADTLARMVAGRKSVLPTDPPPTGGEQ
jgi:hypothetical protein